MKNGSCVKCNAKTVYCADEKYPKNGLMTDSGYPYLKIYRENKWIPDVYSSQMTSYVCRTCGYFEMFVRDLSALEKLDDCDNWKKVEADQ